MKFKLVLFVVSLISILLVSSFFYDKPSEIINNSTHSNELLVYMSPTCNCCKNWAKQLSDYGFRLILSNNLYRAYITGTVARRIIAYCFIYLFIRF